MHRDAVPQPKQLLRVGFATSGSPLFLGETSESVCFDSEGMFTAEGKREAGYVWETIPPWAFAIREGWALRFGVQARGLGSTAWGQPGFSRGVVEGFGGIGRYMEAEFRSHTIDPPPSSCACRIASAWAISRRTATPHANFVALPPPVACARMRARTFRERATRARRGARARGAPHDSRSRPKGWRSCGGLGACATMSCVGRRCLHYGFTTETKTLGLEYWDRSVCRLPMREGACASAAVCATKCGANARPAVRHIHRLGCRVLLFEVRHACGRLRKRYFCTC